MNSPLQKLRQLILPPRPDPARSRRIAEGRLMIGCLVALGIFITIGVRIVGLADASASTHLAKSAAAIITERGRILDRKGRLLAGNLPITVLHADPSEIMDARDVAAKLAPLLNHHDHASLIKLLTKKTRYVELDRQLPPKRHAQILQLGIPGVYFAKGAVRVTRANMLRRIFLAMSTLIILALPESKNHETPSWQQVKMSPYQLILVCRR